MFASQGNDLLTGALLGALALFIPACGDDAVCGSADESPVLLVAEMSSEQVTWENWRSSPNNDCGETGGPISLTLEADQVSTTRGITFCLPRPDKLSKTPVNVSENTRVQIIDVFADLENGTCLATLDRTSPATGTLAFPGLCDDGQHPGGYDIVFDLQIPMTITCGQDTRSELMRFAGDVAVAATLLP